MNGHVTRDLGEQYLCLRDEKPTGTNGGAFTTGAWQTRTLNTIQYDEFALATLNSAFTQFTLPAGKYRCHIIAPAFSVNDHQARLRNITLGTTILDGVLGRSSASNTHDKSYIIGGFQLFDPTVLEVQHWCETTNATDGFGRAANFTVNKNVYTVAQFWRFR